MEPASPSDGEIIQRMFVCRKLRKVRTHINMSSCTITHTITMKGPNHGKHSPNSKTDKHTQNTYARIIRSQTNLAVPGNCGFAHQNRRLPARCQGFSHNCLRQRRREARCEDYRSQTSFTSTARKWRHEGSQ